MVSQMAPMSSRVDVERPLMGNEPLVQTTASEFGMEALSMQELSEVRPLFDIASIAQFRRWGAFVGSRSVEPAQGENLELIFVTHPGASVEMQHRLEAHIEALSQRRLRRALVDEEAFAGYLDEAERGRRTLDGVVMEGGGSDNPDETAALQLSFALVEAAANPVVRLVNSTVYDALRAGASDVHFEVQHRELHIKYRLDGVLQSIRRIEGLDLAHQVISRIKVLADLDISERRVPQDGRFRAEADGREVDFRVSIMPNLAGEDAVLRILDRKHLTGQLRSLTLDALRFDAQVKAFIRRSAQLPHGLLLVTGPTGSGKTTTLYAALTEVNSGLDKIVTIEDPIEYQLPGVLQIPVNEKKGLTFATGLRSILRHDPDKIMVGEIRDSETAQIAVQAALTGHQVFTTVHANNVFDVIGRFKNMGVDTYSLVAALTGVVAQRLVRLACVHCGGTGGGKLPYSVDGSGCSHCRGTGYKGRVAIAETLAMDDEMKDLLIRQAPIVELKAAAERRGFQSLRQAGMELVKQSVTTADELERVAPEI
jgi:general secretion pathway protein E